MPETSQLTGGIHPYEKHRLDEAAHLFGLTLCSNGRKAIADLHTGRLDDFVIIAQSGTSVKLHFRHIHDQLHFQFAFAYRNAMEDPGTLAATFDRFARFYDADYRDYVDDVEAIGLLAADTGDPLLELGCGTGRLLAPLAAAGHTITGVDISPAQLAVARGKLAKAGTARQVTLVEADLRTFQLARADFAFAFCTSNTLMHFVTPEEQLAVLKHAYRHLRSGGILLVDLFNPDVVRLTAANGLMELADQWDDAATGAQVLKWSVRTVDWGEQIQDTLFIYEECLPDGQNRRTLCPFTLRFLWRNEAELMLRLAEFAVDDVWGDFDGGTYSVASDHLILLARKP